MAASFNRSLWEAKGKVLGAEMRAYNNLHWHRDAGGTTSERIGLTGFGPNINIARDPRFGRTSELPGEDPLLNGMYAAAMVKGMQTHDQAGYPMMLAYVKHFTAYSTETNRGHDSYNISKFDLFDTYLPAYETAFTAGGASGAMCAYDAVNGRPSCANDLVLNKLMRGKWAPHAIVTSDCGAVHNLRGPPVMAPSDAAAAAYAINNGTDIEMGSTLYRSALAAAVQQGLTSAAIIDAAVARTQRQLFTLGRYDPPRLSAWTALGAETINATAHRELAYDAALQSLVLLRNDRHALPLARGRHLAVLGPQATSRHAFFSDYYGDDVCWTGSCSGHACFDCIPTVAEAVARMNTAGTTTHAAAVDINSTNASAIPAALSLARDADAVILVLGCDKSIEHEGRDRPDTALPGLQEPFALRVLALQKPTVIVLINGGALAIDKLLLVAGGGDAGGGEAGGGEARGGKRTAPYAIVEAFNPNVVGGTPIAATLFGDENRFGKLPLTMYPHAFIEQKAMSDYDMSSGVGRTYRYYTGRPLFPFGFGLSYSTFATQCALNATELLSMGRSPRRLGCQVRNVGPRSGDEVLLIYHTIGHSLRAQLTHPAPLRALIGFERVSVPVGATVRVEIEITDEMLELVNSEGERVLYPGTHLLEISTEGAGAPTRQIIDVEVV